MTLFFLLPLKLTFCRLPRAEKLIIWSILFLFFSVNAAAVVVVVVVDVVVDIVVVIIIIVAEVVSESFVELDVVT